MAGVFSSGFKKLYSKKFGVFRVAIEVVEPYQVDIASDLPFPDQVYYVSSYAIQWTAIILGCWGSCFLPFCSA